MHGSFEPKALVQNHIYKNKPIWLFIQQVINLGILIFYFQIKDQMSSLPNKYVIFIQ
jgi:hypothetical protein